MIRDRQNKSCRVEASGGAPHPEGERLQDVSLHGGGQQDDGGLRTVLIPVHVNTLTLQQLQAALVWKHLNTQTHTDTQLHD